MDHFLYSIMKEYIAYTHSRIGRPKVFDVDYIIDRIRYVLRTGCQWYHLPVENGSWQTVYRYFSLWSRQRIFEKTFIHLVKFYVKRHGLSSELVTDTSFVKNICGRDCLGKSSVDRGRKASKISALVDLYGVPLTMLFHPGNKNDGKTLLHLLTRAQKNIELSGKILFADKAYDSSRCRHVIAAKGLHNQVTLKRSIPSKEKNRIRICVEHTFGWLDKCRRVILRYDGLIVHFKSFNFLAASQLVCRRLQIFI
jgi:transposase